MLPFRGFQLGRLLVAKGEWNGALAGTRTLGGEQVCGSPFLRHPIVVYAVRGIGRQVTRAAKLQWCHSIPIGFSSYIPSKRPFNHDALGEIPPMRLRSAKYEISPAIHLGFVARWNAPPLGLFPPRSISPNRFCSWEFPPFGQEVFPPFGIGQGGFKELTNPLGR